ncbi:MAG: preprotein translocase subunit YajC, partial [Microbacteriaceae bacterium]
MLQISLLVAETAPPAAAEAQGFDWSLVLMLGVLAVFMLFMFRSNKKRKKTAEEMQDRVQVGADVMTSFGVFGIVKSIDEGTNVVELETSPGTVIR